MTPEEQKSVTFCLHLAAFGCEQCKEIVHREIRLAVEEERERAAKVVEDYCGNQLDTRGYRSDIAAKIREVQP